jgi:hypothetical protein
MQVILRRAFIVSAVLWAAILPAAAFAASRSASSSVWYGLAFVVYGAGSVLCHQLPARSFHLWATQLPVCARCTGIYAGGAIAAVARFVQLKPDATSCRNGHRVRLQPNDAERTRRARWLLATAFLPTAATLAFEWTIGEVPSNVVRALAGLPLGAAAAWIMAGVN